MKASRPLEDGPGGDHGVTIRASAQLEALWGLQDYRGCRVAAALNFGIFVPTCVIASCKCSNKVCSQIHPLGLLGGY